MASFQPTITLFPVSNNKKCITAAANTISLSFSRDPLIQWLRPGARPWEHLGYPTRKWQYRRVQRALFEGIVLQSACVHDIRRKATGLSIFSQPTEERKECRDSGAVVLLFPPKKHLKWSLRRILLAYKVWFLDWVDPPVDRETDDSRLEKLMAAHDLGLQMIERQYKASDVWYLEVIGIHPLLQSCGLGKKVMQQILEYVDGQCIALECTSERNIAFYEKFGFSVVQEIELGGASKLTPGGSDTVKYWLMVREGNRR